MSTYAKVFIIILNWNGEKDTIECLDSLKDLDYTNYEIIVVDNGSSDTSVSEIKNQKLKIKNFILLENKKNLGFSGGNNVGIKYALDNGADYVLLLNNDAVVEPNFLKKLVEMASSSEALAKEDKNYNKNIGILGPRINYFNPRNLIWFNGGEFSWPLKYNYHLDFRKKEEELKDLEPKEVDFITGCSMLVKRYVFEKIGFLDERFFLYFEDMDFCLRAKKATFKIVIMPDAKIYHRISASTQKLENPVVWYYHIRNYLLLIKKNKGLFLNIATRFWAWWIYGKQIVKQMLYSGKREEARIIRQAVTDFYKGMFGKLNQ